MTAKKKNNEFWNVILNQKALVALIIIVVVMVISKPQFAAPVNIAAILKSAAVLAIIGLGEALVIISGGADLSVGGVMCLSGIVTIKMMEHMPTLLACLIGIAVGALVGLINGFLSVHQKTHPFVITLGMGMALTGICLQLSDGRPIYPSSPSLSKFGNMTILGIPAIAFWAIIITLVMYYVMSRTQYGRNCYAVGGDYEIAENSGINALRTKWLAYILCGILTAVGGIFLTARLNSGSATYGETTSLYVCCCVVLGGTSFSGGVGGMVRTAIGILFFSVLDNALPMFSVFAANVYLQQMIKGILIVAVIGMAYYAEKRERMRV